jgi:hypothetical protein
MFAMRVFLFRILARIPETSDAEARLVVFVIVKGTFRHTFGTLLKAKGEGVKTA